MSATDAVLVGTSSGERVLYVGPELSEDLPGQVLEGLTRRRLVGLGQPCPCGARMVVPDRAARRAAVRAGRSVLHVDVTHEDGCPAVHGQLLRGLA